MNQDTHDFLNLWHDLNLIHEDFLEKLEKLVKDYKRSMMWYRARSDKKIKDLEWDSKTG